MDGVQVFSATLAKDREYLGERVTAWLRLNPNKKITDRVVVQSSDSEYHCLSIILFWTDG